MHWYWGEEGRIKMVMWRTLQCYWDVEGRMSMGRVAEVALVLGRGSEQENRGGRRDVHWDWVGQGEWE